MTIMQIIFDITDWLLFLNLLLIIDFQFEK